MTCIGNPLPGLPSLRRIISPSLKTISVGTVSIPKVSQSGLSSLLRSMISASIPSSRSLDSKRGAKILQKGHQDAANRTAIVPDFLRFLPSKSNEVSPVNHSLVDVNATFVFSIPLNSARTSLSIWVSHSNSQKCSPFITLCDPPEIFSTPFPWERHLGYVFLVACVRRKNGSTVHCSHFDFHRYPPFSGR